MDKEKYVLHYENMKLYLRLRLKLKYIHRVLEFNQLQWLKPYIEFHTQKRIEVEKNGDKDEKTLFKLMINAVFGKKIKSLRNRTDVKLVNTKKDCLKCTSNPSCTSDKIFNNTSVAIRKSKVSLKLNKLEYTGMCILELNKVLIYEFHYDYIKNKYGSKSKLLFTDIDSLIYKIKTEDVYEDFSSNTEIFDFSNYSTKSKKLWWLKKKKKK